MTQNKWGSPFAKDQRISKEPKEPKEKVKKVSRLTKSDARLFLDIPSSEVSSKEMDWVDRWLNHFVLENSFPPQIARSGGYSYLLSFLTDRSAEVLSKLRDEFARTHLGYVCGDDFGFLTGVPMVE